MSDYRVNLEVFAGPLDLLLYLVRKEEVDIYDIPIARLTEQYITYVDLLRELDIDVAGDFLVMAATLMEIKSAMLLPRVSAQEQEAEAVSGDPRSELIRQLLEYKKFKDAANLLSSAAESHGQRFARPDSIVSKLVPQKEPQIDMDQVDVWALLEAFDAILKATGNVVFADRIKDETPIDRYQVQMLGRLQSEGPMPFERLFGGGRHKLALVGMFLALLELVRNKLVWAEQNESFSSIYVRALTDEDAAEAVSRAILSSVEDISADEAAKDLEPRAGEDTTEMLENTEGQPSVDEG